MSYKTNGKTYNKSKFVIFLDIIEHMEWQIEIIYVDDIKRFSEVSLNYYGKDFGLADGIDDAIIFDIPINESKIFVDRNHYLAVKSNGTTITGEYC